MGILFSMPGGTAKISGLDNGALGPFHMGKLAINDTGEQIIWPSAQPMMSSGMRYVINRRRRKQQCW